jgi:hypothetical protein
LKSLLLSQFQITSSSKVSIVVDPAYGERLKELGPEGNSVWVVKSNTNESIFRKLYASSGEHLGLTSYGQNTHAAEE